MNYYETCSYFKSQSCFDCKECWDRRKLNMVQTKLLKITAEVNGKIVPLNTISTESFEAIKALEKSKEIPVARLADYPNCGRRLIFKVTESIAEQKNQYVAMDLISGLVSGHWPEDNGDCGSKYGYNYENIKPL